jgi:stage V sporulation protein AE
MIYLNSFLFCGIVCLIGEIILDNTKLTPGHITSIFVCVGAFLSFLGIYDNFISWAGVGASVPITSFGNSLYQACLEGYKTSGLLGMFTNMLSTTSGGICSSIIFAFIVSLFCNPKK